MRFNQKHLKIALVILVLALLYNVWAFVRRSGPGGSVTGSSAQRSVAAEEFEEPRRGLDPATVEAAPAVDLNRAPAWSRNPLENLNPPARQRARAPVDTGPLPQLQAILYSGTRGLALVDGRVTAVGDELSNGTVTAIEREAVVVQTAGGERRITLARPALFAGDDPEAIEQAQLQDAFDRASRFRGRDVIGVSEMTR